MKITYLEKTNSFEIKSVMMKLNNKISQLLAFAAILCISYSCTKDLYNEQAGTRITPEQHYNSQIDLFNSVYGTYIPLQEALPRLLLIDGLRSDMIDVTSYSDAFMKEINNQEFSLGNPYIDGSDYYKVIINVNEILKYIDEVWKKDPPNPQVHDMPKYTNGALINIRSWCYFTLVRLFGQAALINDNMPSLEAKQTFLYKKDMIDTLINQLKPYVFNTTLYIEYQFPGPNTKSLLGELYLENASQYGTPYYDSAVYYLKLGMESYGNTATYKVTDDYSREKWPLILYSDGTGIENIDVVYFDSHRDQYNNFSNWALPQNYMIKPTQLLVNSFNAQISSETGFAGDIYRGKGITFDTIPYKKDSFYISKYNLEKGDPLSSYIITSRAADIHLLMAEALNQLGDTTTALLLLNNGIKSASSTPDGYSQWSVNIGIRGRVSLLPKRIPADVNLSDPEAVKNAIEDMIMDERALELAFEGKRWFDLVRVAERRNIVTPESGTNYLANKVAAKFADPTKAEAIRTKLLNQSNWYLPVK